MHINNIKYTAQLIHYIARCLHTSAEHISKKISEAGILRLCHNAPMNRILPINQIAKEVISDYHLLGVFHLSDLELSDQEYGEKISLDILQATTNEKEYANIFVNLLLNI